MADFTIYPTDRIDFHVCDSGVRLESDEMTIWVDETQLDEVIHYLQMAKDLIDE